MIGALEIGFVVLWWDLQRLLCGCLFSTITLAAIAGLRLSKRFLRNSKTSAINNSRAPRYDSLAINISGLSQMCRLSMIRRFYVLGLLHDDEPSRGCVAGLYTQL